MWRLAEGWQLMQRSPFGHGINRCNSYFCPLHFPQRRLTEWTSVAVCTFCFCVKRDTIVSKPCFDSAVVGTMECIHRDYWSLAEETEERIHFYTTQSPASTELWTQEKKRRKEVMKAAAAVTVYL